MSARSATARRKLSENERKDARGDGLLAPAPSFHSTHSAPDVGTTESDSGTGGFRNLLDKKTNEVKKGFSRKFAFRKKNKGAAVKGYETKDNEVGQRDARRHSYSQSENSMEMRQGSIKSQPPPSLHRTQMDNSYSRQSFMQDRPGDRLGLPYTIEGGHHARSVSDFERLSISNEGPSPVSDAQRLQTTANLYRMHSFRQYPLSPAEARAREDSWDLSPLSQPPMKQLPETPPHKRLSSHHFSGPIIMWTGGGRPPTRWDNPQRDPELWDRQGNVLIFLDAPGKGYPRFRLSSQMIESWGNRYLSAQLHEGQTSTYVSHPLAPPEDFIDTITYELYFPPPNSVDATRHQVATRNVFAMYRRASIIGFSLYQSLSDLYARLMLYHSAGEVSVAAQVIRYILTRHLDDVRDDPEAAISLLAWSERTWSAGWKEAFLHCAGMYNRVLERCADWGAVEPLTKSLLERAWTETKTRIHGVQNRLAEFDYADMWPFRAIDSSAERLQDMLVLHYFRVYGAWPPKSSDERWLTRSIVKEIQQDFAALYDYLVDRSISWDVSEARAGRKWEMLSESGSNDFQADVPAIPMTDMVVEFDNAMRVPHIPHPFPLLPPSVPLQDTEDEQGQGRSVRERRVSHAYSKSFNDDYSPSPSGLVDTFARFEKNDLDKQVDPAMARRARWVVIYGILQTLASMSTDAPGVKYHSGVSYHLSARVHKPSWSRAPRLFSTDYHTKSHCWTVPSTWDSDDGKEDEDGDRVGSEFCRVSSVERPRLYEARGLSPPGPSRTSSSGFSRGTRSNTQTPGESSSGRTSSGGVDIAVPRSQRPGIVQMPMFGVEWASEILGMDSNQGQGGDKWDDNGKGVDDGTKSQGTPVIRDFDEEGCLAD